MDDLVVERPVEMDHRPLGRRAADGPPLIWVTAAATVPFSATVMLAAWPACVDHQAALDCVEVGRGLERLLQAQVSEDLAQVKVALLVPPWQVDLHGSRGGGFKGQGSVGGFLRGPGPGGPGIRQHQPHHETLGIGQVHRLPACTLGEGRS